MFPVCLFGSSHNDPDVFQCVLFKLFVFRDLGWWWFLDLSLVNQPHTEANYKEALLEAAPQEKQGKNVAGCPISKNGKRGGSKKWMKEMITNVYCRSKTGCYMICYSLKSPQLDSKHAECFLEAHHTLDTLGIWNLKESCAYSTGENSFHQQ